MHAEQRATQGFVATLSYVRARPSLTLLEVAWRWAFGIPAIALVWQEATKVFAASPWRSTGIESLSVNQLLTDPMRASVMIADFAAVVGPGLLHAAAWVAPLLLVAWAVLSGLGRVLVLRRMDRAMQPRAATMIALQVLRTLPLALLFAAWLLGVRALGRWCILAPVGVGADPSIMLYVGGVIVLSLGLFVLSALVGWVFSLAPLLSAMRGRGVMSSLREAARTGGLQSGLIEINLVLGITKIALLVLAVVFSACPLPFQTELTDEFLFWWNCAVAVWYFLASDFFHVARLAAYLSLVRSAKIRPAE